MRSNVWIRLVALTIALAGVIWAMQSLRNPDTLQSPNNPAQILMGGEQPPESIPAKVQFEKKKPSK